MSQANFNCECLDTTSNQTLAQLRRRMMVRLGYAAMANNPPPGMPDLIDDFLRDAQQELYRKNPVLRSERLFRWTMVAGISYYGLRDNDTSTDFSDEDCGRHLDDQNFNISWVGLQDLNNMWRPLVCGIDPTFYTTAQQEGLPQRYEIRSCIEVFPVPNAPYKLWIKGQMGLEPFTGNDDQTTLDSDLVFEWALARAKEHYGQGDAKSVMDHAQGMLSDLVAGNHLTRRYIPNKPNLPPAVQPVMIEFVPPGQ